MKIIEGGVRDCNLLTGFVLSLPQEGGPYSNSDLMESDSMYISPMLLCIWLYAEKIHTPVCLSPCMMETHALPHQCLDVDEKTAGCCMVMTLVITR